LRCGVKADDRQLVASLKAGDERAFRAFFDEYFSRVYRFAMSRVGGNAQLAEEATQRALTRAVRALASFRGDASLFSWLAQICRNELADLIAAEARDRSRAVSLDTESAARDAALAVATDDDDALREREKLEKAAAIRQVLDRLPGRYGEILEWKYIDEWTVEQIASRLELSFEAAQSQLQRARAAFKSAVAASDIEADL
jgi:RNA polymerase sigma-70 factor, ECF subfamily